MRKSFYGEVIEADRLLSITTTSDLLHKRLLRQKVIIEIAARRGSIFNYHRLFYIFFEFFIVYTLALLFPIGVNKLHIPIKAAKLRQKFSLVHILFTIFHVFFNARFFFKSFICIFLGLIYGLTK